VRTLITALTVALVIPLATPALLDAQQRQQNEQNRPGTTTTEVPGTADRGTDMDWGWLGLLGLAGLLGLRRREVHRDTAARDRRATGTYG
jgi:MYXO-CTERM domain-containing protein